MAKKINMLELKINFNDVCMRELGLDIDDNNHIYDMDTESIYKMKDRFIKYSEDEYPVLAHDEIDLNLIENPRLMEILFGTWIIKWKNSRIARGQNIQDISSFYQSAIRGSSKGFFVVTYIENGESKEIKSGTFVNESVRILHLITILNHTSHYYDFDKFDIEIPRKDKK